MKGRLSRAWIRLVNLRGISERASAAEESRDDRESGCPKDVSVERVRGLGGTACVSPSPPPMASACSGCENLVGVTEFGSTDDHVPRHACVLTIRLGNGMRHVHCR